MLVVQCFCAKNVVKFSLIWLVHNLLKNKQAVFYLFKNENFCCSFHVLMILFKYILAYKK